jgi:hypothetical protein
MPSDSKSSSVSVVRTIPAIMGEMLHERMSLAFADLGKAVTPIYRADPRAEKQGRPQHIGSGVLLKRGNGHFLVTAAHVVDHKKLSHLYIPAQRRLCKLEGNGIATTAPKGERDDDRYDFSVIELAAGVVEALGDVRYVTEIEFCGTDTDISGHGLMALGFPVSKNKKINHAKRQIHPKRLSYGATVLKDDEFAQKLAISGEDHLFVKYEKRSRVAGGAVVDSFHPTGMSGGALIDLGKIASLSALGQKSDGRFRVAGILIEYYKNENRMVSVKTETILGVL